MFCNPPPRPTPAALWIVRPRSPQRRLWRAGRIVPLTPKAYAVLLYLAEHAGRLVTKHHRRCRNEHIGGRGIDSAPANHQHVICCRLERLVVGAGTVREVDVLRMRRSTASDRQVVQVARLRGRLAASASACGYRARQLDVDCHSAPRSRAADQTIPAKRRRQRRGRCDDE
jgi:hypothetical protein